MPTFFDDALVFAVAMLELEIQFVEDVPDPP